jgi:hypothetical protein
MSRLYGCDVIVYVIICGLAVAAEYTVYIGSVKLTSDRFYGNRVFK